MSKHFRIPNPLYDLVLVVVVYLFFLPFLLYDCQTLLVRSLMIIAVLFFGVSIPRWFKCRTRYKLAEEKRKKESDRWGFCGMPGDGPWIAHVDYPVIINSEIADGKRFYSEWLIIHDGIIIVNPGASSFNKNKTEVKYDFTDHRTYAWDGCTPKRFFLWLCMIGTPDWGPACIDIKIINKNGVVDDEQVFWQRAFYASLVHDALFQYLDNIPIKRKDVNRLFRGMLRYSGMNLILSFVYYCMVCLFGAAGTKQKGIGKRSKLKISSVPKLKDRFPVK